MSTMRGSQDAHDTKSVLFHSTSTCGRSCLSKAQRETRQCRLLSQSCARCAYSWAAPSSFVDGEDAPMLRSVGDHTWSSLLSPPRPAVTSWCLRLRGTGKLDHVFLVLNILSSISSCLVGTSWCLTCLRSTRTFDVNLR